MGPESGPQNLGGGCGRILEVSTVSSNYPDHMNVLKDPAYAQACKLPCVLFGIAFMFSEIEVPLHKITEVQGKFF
jgi:hypothetical protein